MRYIGLIAAILALAVFSCAAETLTVPAEIELVGAEAFCGLRDAERVVVSEGVREIESRAFADSAVSEASLPASLAFIADDAFEGCVGLRVTAPEGSYAFDWAVSHGFAEPTPFVASAGKDFSSFSDARGMVETECRTEWSGTGRVRYVEQFGGARTYVPEYWVSRSDAAGSCTRAAGSMAASYMGIDALPRDAADFSKFQTLVKNLGGAPSTHSACTLETFLRWYDDYARDGTGRVSPVVIYTNYGTSTHAFVVIGRDSSAHDCFYVADSGSSGCVNRVRLGVENGRVYVDEYVRSTGTVDTRYGKEHRIIYFWRYARTGA